MGNEEEYREAGVLDVVVDVAGQADDGSPILKTLQLEDCNNNNNGDEDKNDKAWKGQLGDEESQLLSNPSMNPEMAESVLFSQTSTPTSSPVVSHPLASSSSYRSHRKSSSSYESPGLLSPSSSSSDSPSFQFPSSSSPPSSKSPSSKMTKSSGETPSSQLDQSNNKQSNHLEPSQDNDSCLRHSNDRLQGSQERKLKKTRKIDIVEEEDCSAIVDKDNQVDEESDKDDNRKRRIIDMNTTMTTTNTEDALKDTNNNKTHTHNSDNIHTQEKENVDDDDRVRGNNHESQSDMKPSDTEANNHNARVISSPARQQDDQDAEEMDHQDGAEDDDSMSNFDPSEVLKRMKVELKEEFDDSYSNGQVIMNHSQDDDEGSSEGLAAKLPMLKNFTQSPFFGASNLFDLENNSTGGSFAAAFAAAAATAAVSGNSNGGSQEMFEEQKRRILHSLILKHLNNSDDSDGASGVSDPASLWGGLSQQALLSALTYHHQQQQQMQSAAVATATNSSASPPMHFDDASLRYCSQCNIQFQSFKTFKVHKELYCSTRHQNSPNSLSNSSSSASGPSSLSSGVPPTTTTSSNLSMAYGGVQSVGSVGSAGSNSSSSSSSSNASNCNSINTPNSSNGSTNAASNGNGNKANSVHNSQTSSSGFGSSPPQTLSSSSSQSPNSDKPSNISSGAGQQQQMQQSELESDRDGRDARRQSIDIGQSKRVPDFGAMFPGLMYPPQSGLNLPNADPLAAAAFLLSKTMAQQQQPQQPTSSPFSDPIFIAVSTNPLVLLPFVMNPSTGSLVPLSSVSNEANARAGTGLELPSSLDPSSTKGLTSNSPIIFPSGLPQAKQQQPSAPFITTFSNLSQHFKNKNDDADKIGKKRSFSSIEADQPLDLSSGQSFDQLATKRVRHDNETTNDGSNLDLMDLAVKLTKSLNGEVSENEALKKFEQDNPPPVMAALLEKLVLLQAMSSSGSNGTLAPSSPPPPTPLSSESYANMDSNSALASISTQFRDNPAFAQYFSMAMAALSNSAGASQMSNGSTVPESQTQTSTSQPSQSPQVNIVVKQGNSRCAECNIVFYKHENYLVHKELYCASRRTTGDNATSVSPKSNLTIETATSPRASSNTLNRPRSNTSANTAPSPSLSSTSNSMLINQKLGPPASIASALASPKIKQELTLSTSPGLPACSISPVASSGPLLSPNANSSNACGGKSTIFQYYCAACGIKFTSYNNLQAHQTYYCLKRTPPGGASRAMSSLIPPATATPSSLSPLSALMANPTAAAAMTSLLSPSLLARVSAGMARAGPNGERSADMIDFTNPQSWGALVAAAATAAAAESKPSLCLKCKAVFVTPEMLVAHICPAENAVGPRMCDKAEKPMATNNTTTASSLQTYKCTICGYKGHTMRGMRTHVRVHSDELSASGAYEEDFIVANTDLPEQMGSTRRASNQAGLSASSRNRRRSSANVDPNHVNAFLSSNAAAMAAATFLNEIEKQKTLNGCEAPSISITPVPNEPQVSPTKLPSGGGGGGSLSPNDNYVSTQTHNCQFCRYNSNYKGNVIRHIKLVHKDVNAVLETIAFQQGKAVTAIMEEPDFAQLLEESFQAFKRESLLSAKSPTKHLNGEALGKENNNSNNGDNEDRDSVGPSSSSKSMADSPNPPDMKYCSACNISFTYRNSYLAHKKYYCSSNSVDA